MLNIFFASFTVGLGSYLLRRGDLLRLISYFLKMTLPPLDIQFLYTFLGIILNLMSIYFWQSSAKSDLSYPLAYSFYLSGGLLIGIITSSIFEKINLGLNIFIGTFFVILGIIILTNNN